MTEEEILKACVKVEVVRKNAWKVFIPIFIKNEEWAAVLVIQTGEDSFEVSDNGQAVQSALSFVASKDRLRVEQTVLRILSSCPFTHGNAITLKNITRFDLIQAVAKTANASKVLFQSLESAILERYF